MADIPTRSPHEIAVHLLRILEEEDPQSYLGDLLDIERGRVAIDGHWDLKRVVERLLVTLSGPSREG